MSKYIKVAEYKFVDAMAEARAMGIPCVLRENYLEFDMRNEPVTEPSCLCYEPKSARAYLRQVRAIRNTRKNR